MIDKELQQAINDQINREFYAAFLYLGMSAHLDSQNFTGMAHWMRVQYEEELTHALKFVDFLTDKGGTVELQDVKAPSTDFDSPLSCFEAAHEHEREVTGHLGELYDLAWKKKDRAAHVLLEWFLTEQVEEEKMTEELVAKFRLAGENGAALLMLENELRQRTSGAATGVQAEAA